MSISVVLADDHAVMREGLRFLLEKGSYIKVVGEAGDGREAVEMVRDLHPDVVVVDIAMPGLNGIEATRQIRDISPSTEVVILSMYDTSEHIHQALLAGAKGYVLKGSSGTEIVKAVHSVHAKQRYYCEQVREHSGARLLNEGASPLGRLSGREREILQLVVEGKTSSEIAGLLGLSPKTVDTYRGRLMAKIGITNIPDLVKFAIQHGVISPT